MADATLPEDVMVLILRLLPVKSLIRFTCVSKRFHSIILSDPKFAKSQFETARDRKTLDRRLLYNTTIHPLNRRVRDSTISTRLESLLLETTSFGYSSSVRRLKYPFRPPAGNDLLLGSSNGIVFLAFDKKVFYAWNPSTGFYNELPDPGDLCDQQYCFRSGVGYLSATNEYKVFIASDQTRYGIFSSRAQTWKRLEAIPESCLYSPRGTLLNEALHWIDHDNGLMVFDLAQEKFRKMALPKFDERGLNQWGNLGVSADGCLSFAYSTKADRDCLCVWVMKEYGVLDSWTKLFNLFSNPPEGLWGYGSVLVLETSIVAHIYTITKVDDCNYADVKGWIKILHKEEDKCGMYMVEGFDLKMIQYQETLLRLDD
ncbi:PREDICTED: F-box protein CPR30-like [Fragaria vesca subsp. vesca]